jgi:hypothetical protein
MKARSDCHVLPEPAISDGNRPSALEAQLNLSRKGYCTAILLGVLVVLGFCREQVFDLSEYFVLYAGERLVGTSYLYDKAHNREEDIKAAGGYGGDESIYSRLPFEAALLWPLGRLPYRASLLLFEALSAAALAGFVILWPLSTRWMTALACAWSLPLAMVLGVVRDNIFLLFLLAVALRIYRRRPWLAGMLLTLLGMKFHLFLLLPLLFLGQRRWKMASGFAVGCTVLTGISFAVAGANWPFQMAAVVRGATIQRLYLMPNIRGTLQGLTSSSVPEVVLGAIVAGVVLWLVARSGFEYGMCAVLVGSLLVSHHAGIYDCVQLIPVLLLLGGNGDSKTAIWCLILLSPLPYWALESGGMPALLVRLAIISLLFLLHYQVAAIDSPWRRRVPVN